MKIEIWGNFPEYFKPLYPEEFKLFSHFEKTAGVPTVFLQLLPIKKMENRMSAFTPGAVFTETKRRFSL